MARRRSMYGKKRKINYGRILLLVALLVLVVAIVFLLLRKEKYINVIDEVLNSDINNISGTVSSISKVDFTVYSNKGIRYTNQHEDIKNIRDFNGTNSDDADTVENVKMLFENLVKSKETVTLDNLPVKENGYYWIDANFAIEDEKLFFNDDEEYNFDIFYDIESKDIYIKEEYFSEFSTKNNKLKIQGYEATDEFVDLIEEITKKREN